jgi:hypothetical protein
MADIAANALPESQVCRQLQTKTNRQTERERQMEINRRTAVL